MLSFARSHQDHERQGCDPRVRNYEATNSPRWARFSGLFPIAIIMKRWLLALLISLSAAAAPAVELLSTAINDNGNSGIMFDLRALNTTTVNTFSILQASLLGPNDVTVYTKTGTHVGFENSPGSWTLLGTVSMIADGTRKQIPLRFDVSVPAGQTQAFFILSASDLQYQTDGTIGIVYGSDANLEILSGTGKAGFGPGGNIGRALVGSVIYNLLPLDAVAAVSGTPQSTTVSTAFGAPLRVRVTDTGSLPVSGVQVSFSTPGGASATLSASTCNTDVNGECSVTATANATGGTYNVEATVIGVATPAVFALTNTIAVAPTPASIPTLSEWGLILMSSLVALFGIARARRRS